MTTPLDRWLALHPFLEPVARLERAVEAAAGGATHRGLALPRWVTYGEPHARGVPLLRSHAAELPAAAEAAPVLEAVVERVAAADVPDAIGNGARALAAALRAGPGEAERMLAWVIAGAPGEGAPAERGLARYLGWKALRPVIAPIVEEYARWRVQDGEDRWARPDCPTCGALPMMAQLVEEGDGRARLLACGCCGTRWRWKRLACPHCGNDAQERLEVLEPEGDARVRLDVCRECQGYVKTYAGEGEEALFLADWPTLHLDLLARERGLERRGASLYDP